MYIKRGAILLVCLMSLSAFASTYKSGHFQGQIGYEIHCNDGQTSTCWGYLNLPSSAKSACRWKCTPNDNKKKVVIYAYPRRDCNVLTVLWAVEGVQFNSLKEAQQLVGNKECARL